MNEELRTYRALAITLIATIVLSVGLFVHSLMIETRRNERLLDERIGTLAVRVEARLGFFTERIDALARAARLVGGETLADRWVRESGLDPVHWTLCLADGPRLRDLQAPGRGDDAAGDGCAAAAALPPNGRDRGSSGSRWQIGVRGAEPIVDFALRIDTTRTLYASVAAERLSVPLLKAVADPDLPLEQACLQLTLADAPRTIGCERAPARYATTDLHAADTDPRGDRTTSFTVRGFHWQLSVTPDHRRLAMDSIRLPFTLFGLALALGATLCAFVFSATSRNLRAEASARSLRKLSDKLEEQNRSLEQFAAMAAHDLQAPMRFIVATSHVLLAEVEELERPDLVELGETVIAQGERMRALLVDLLEFCRSGDGQLALGALDVGSLVDEELRLLTAREEYAATRVSIGPMPARLVGDAIKLTQVFRNLLGNAFKFSRSAEKPHVSIGATFVRHPDRWLFRIEDNGPGIAPEHRERVFLPFRRLDESIEGTGMGLAIVQKIVEHHGGDISIDAAHERGTAFHFTLPASQDTYHS